MRSEPRAASGSGGSSGFGAEQPLMQQDDDPPALVGQVFLPPRVPQLPLLDPFLLAPYAIPGTFAPQYRPADFVKPLAKPRAILRRRL